MKMANKNFKIYTNLPSIHSLSGLPSFENLVDILTMTLFALPGIQARQIYS
jgi:hypothetical protein